MRRLCKTAGLGLVRHTSRVIAAAGGAVTIGDLTVAAGVSSTHLAQRFKQVIGFTPKRLDRTDRFAAAVRAIDPSSGRHRERRRGSASDARRRRRGSSSCASWPFLPLARRAGNSPPGDCSGDCFVSS
jgi:hypothetical protein